MRNRYYQGPLSDHFDGERFFHPGLPSADKSLLDLLKWKIAGQSAPWPKEVLTPAAAHPPAREHGMRITHIGHASYLIQADSLNVLVDPVWADRASPLQRAGPRRHNPPAIAFDDLPSIDAVLVSHNHYDHLDTSSIRRLWEMHHPRIITPLGNDAIIRSATHDIDVESGDWWTTFTLTPHIRVTIVPAYHWSSRTIGDFRMALWGGFVIETRVGTIYCAGDTAYRDGAIFPEIGRRFGPPLVAIVPIGAYAPRWFMETQHADPVEAVQIGRDCGATHVLGVHWGTFKLTDEPFHEPRERFEEAARTHGVASVHYAAMCPGDTWIAPQAP